MTGGFRRLRRLSGTTMAEMPVALWLIILMCFPMLMLATTTLRYGFFWNACREAAQRASACQTFLVDTPQGQSACTTADFWVNKAVGSFSGITVVGAPNVYILQTNVATQTQTKNPNRTPLAVAADTNTYIYDIQVELNGQVDPLIPFISMMGSVPGLTGPFPVTVRSQYSCEIPQGLNQ